MLYLIYFSVEVLHLCCDTGFFFYRKNALLKVAECGKLGLGGRVVPWLCPLLTAGGLQVFLKQISQ